MPDQKPKSRDLREAMLARKMNMGLALDPVREYFNKGRAWIGMGNRELPFVAPPSWFQPDPLVVGQPGVAIAAKKLLDLDPITKTGVSTITQGPNTASMRQMQHSGLDPSWFGGTTLQGIYDRHSHEIGVNPQMTAGETLRTLAHEMAHASAYDENGARGVEGLVAPDDNEESQNMEVLLQELMRNLKAKGIKAELK